MAKAQPELVPANPPFAEHVIRWQAAHGRSGLPWQGSGDPYRVWLSEIMLQQTQVATVRGYFDRFVARFPDVQSLASASPDEVVALWSGLGYYSRARNLHRCAQQVVALHDGVFPRTAAALQTLPGIGRSTAAAIAAFCFGERVAILDGNVKRVLARVVGFDRDLAKAANERALWELATELLPQHDAARAMPRYTQGLMDLGATLCHTRKPSCDHCPLAGVCVGRRVGEPERYPVRTRNISRRTLDWWLLLAREEHGRVWLQRRPATGIWAGLLCPPVYESRAALELALRAACEPADIDRLPEISHTLTHRDLRLHPLLATVDSSRWREPHRVTDVGLGSVEPQGGGTWVGPDIWAAHGLPAPIRTLLGSLQML